MLYREADILYREANVDKFPKKLKTFFFGFCDIRGSKSDMPTNKAMATSWLKKILKKQEMSESDFEQKSSADQDAILAGGIEGTFSRYGKCQQLSQYEKSALK